jgi:hypothetical protein
MAVTITFSEDEQSGQVRAVLEADRNEALTESYQAAYALLKRGHSKRELSNHPRWPGGFELGFREDKTSTKEVKKDGYR